MYMCVNSVDKCMLITVKKCLLFKYVDLFWSLVMIFVHIPQYVNLFME